MNKAELVKKIADQANLTKAEAERAVNAFMSLVKDTVAEGESVQLVGFGTFETVQRAAREGRNPQTGDKVSIPATKVPKFKAGSAFKDAVKG